MTDLGSLAAYPSPPNTYSSPDNQPSISSLYERAAMASYESPPGVGNAAAFGGSAASAESANDKSSPLSLNLNFIKNLTDKRTTRDGNPPKRRGPKPDSKPALTRRQELNRQAQRTHRERKELYIKALEDEVLRLKEIYSNISQDKERLAEENRQLKALMVQNGMSMPVGSGGSTLLGGAGSSLLDDSISNPASVGYGSSASVTGSGTGGGGASSHTSAYTPPPLSALSTGSGSQQMQGLQQQQQQQMRGVSPGSHYGHQHGHGHGHSPLGHGQQQQQRRQPAVDYDQAGIDFVLTLEKPCMNHLPWLLERGADSGGHEPCGHALMASCPPEPFPELTPDIPFGYNNVNVGGAAPPAGVITAVGNTGSGGKKLTATDPAGQQQRTWELSKADLATLLDLSKRLNLDGEITPVMAWGMVLAHPRLGELRGEDFERMTDELGSKVRCYGFGAVMEEFEVRDALENVFSTKPEPIGAIMAY